MTATSGADLPLEYSLQLPPRAGFLQEMPKAVGIDAGKTATAF